MIQLDNRKILDDGTVICSQKAIIEMLYSDIGIENAIVEPGNDILLYNETDKFLDTNFGNLLVSEQPIYDNVNWFNYWLTPEEYKSIDIENEILSRCTSETEFFRAHQELELFKNRNLFPVLKHLLYLVDTWRANQVLWGVGRGSSVSSFVLYLIGINRINPLEFDLDISEFLK